ncbi:hypothetical protein AQUCO_01200169v1 [Aquilegia coerulea]|uniref:Flavonoid 3'-monooxygenase-like n=1 Tax=Aquilegia coerulea TaxID=218851 RepID=A0A2G5E4R5_AQUCA|nr:hypothetical protein AQUCO_01200169v1 [Aquilegia coerulea]
MESSLVPLALACLVAIVFILKKIRNPKRKTPPGPKPWPIVGNLLQLGTLPHMALHEFAKKYGELMQLKYGSRTVLVATSPKMAETFLKTFDSVFASRPPLASGKYTGYDFQDMTWAPYGPHWRKARKIYLTELFTPKRLDSFEYIRVEERRTFLSGLYAQRGNPVVIKNHIRRYTLSSISRVVLSDKFFSDHKTDTSLVSISEFHEMIDEWMVLNGVLNIGDWIPWLSFFDLQGYVKRMKILNEKFEVFHNYVIADHMAKKDLAGKDFVPKDMVDVLLQFAEDDTAPDVKLTIDAVKALVHDLMPGGTDTSGVTMEWAIHELLRHPRVLAKLREEIDRVTGGERWVQENDYPEMPYLEAVIKETLRLHPLSPLLAPHFAIEDCNVAGYDIAKGTIVLINTWSIGRHPDHWDDPYEFKPERFLQGKEIGMTGQDFSLLPFGSGRRKCPGYSLGLRLVRTTVANVFHGFNWKFPEGMKPEDICMVERYGLTTCPEIPASVIPEPRLPIHLYK